VQSLIDEGKITEEEAAVHPKRMLLLRALDGMHGTQPDLELRESQAGDRYLLCSDGLHGVVSLDDISRILVAVGDPDEAAAELISLAMQNGAPDNVTCIVADVVPAAATMPFPTSEEPAQA
jgi:protein phosphatase